MELDRPDDIGEDAQRLEGVNPCQDGQAPGQDGQIVAPNGASWVLLELVLLEPWVLLEP